MKYVWFYIVGVIVGVSIAYGFYALSTQTNKPEKSPKISASKVLEDNLYTIIEPPKQSIKGQIATYSGTLLFESRTATMPAEMKNVKHAQQGERFVTKYDGTIILTFNNLGTIALSENSDLYLIQTLPTNFVVDQKNGTVSYKISGNVPLSIKIRSAILNKTTAGTLQIELTDGDPIIIISPSEGDARIGFNDLDYISRVFNLRSGEVYEYNSDERTAINIENK